MTKKYLSYDTFKQQCISEGGNLWLPVSESQFYELSDEEYCKIIKQGIDHAIQTLENDGYATELVKSLAEDIQEGDLESLVWFQEDLITLVEMGLM